MELYLLIILGILSACLLCCTLTCIGCCCSTSSFKKKVKAEIESTAEIIQTKNGPVEVNRRGNAPYALCLHGTPGVHDGKLNYFNFLTDNGVGVIAPSRPGYGRTPLTSGKTHEQAADLMAALLDSLNIDKVVVIGTSGGGTTAFNFALRHPDRCAGCMTEVAVSGDFNHPKIEELQSFFAKSSMTSPFTARMTGYVASRKPEMMVNMMMDEMSLFKGPDKEAQVKEIINDPERIKLLGKMMDEVAGFSIYPNTADAMVNDLNEFVKPINFAEIKVPTLVVHGNMDGDIPFSQAE